MSQSIGRARALVGKILELRSRGDLGTSIGRSRERYRRIVMAVGAGFVARAVALVTNFVSIPIMIGHLGTSGYAVWAITTAAVGWATLLDFGLFASLVNHLSDAYGRNQQTLAVRLYATALATLLIVATSLALLVLATASWIPWTNLFGLTGRVSDALLVRCATAALVSFAFALPFSVVRATLAAYQETHVANVAMTIGSVSNFAMVVIGAHFGVSLDVLIWMLGIAGLAPGIFAFSFLWRRFPFLRLHARDVSLKALKALVRTSLPLLFVQIGAVAITQLQPILLARYSTLADVSVYNILMRVYAAGYGIVIIAAAPFFPPLREALARGDAPWFRRAAGRAISLRLAISVALGLGFALALPWLVREWCSGKINVTYTAAYSVAILLVANAIAGHFHDLVVILDGGWRLVVAVLANVLMTSVATVLLVRASGSTGAILGNIAFPVLIWSWLGPFSVRALLPQFSRPPANPSRTL